MIKFAKVTELKAFNLEEELDQIVDQTRKYNCKNKA